MCEINGFIFIYTDLTLIAMIVTLIAALQVLLLLLLLLLLFLTYFLFLSLSPFTSLFLTFLLQLSSFLSLPSLPPFSYSLSPASNMTFEPLIAKRGKAKHGKTRRSEPLIARLTHLHLLTYTVAVWVCRLVLSCLI